MRYYKKKNVPLLLVPLLIIIFFSGNASADTYSFSVSSTSGDRDIFSFRVNSVGTINGEATWTGSAADLALILNGPGQEGYYAWDDGLSPLSLSYTVTTADLNKGTDWRLSIVNFGGGDATGTVTILYPTDLVIAMTHPDMVSIVEPRTDPERLSIVEPRTDEIFERAAWEVEPIPRDAELIILPFIYIDIDSSPQGAQIWIDDEYCGVTPLREYFDRPGNHTFKLSLHGYQHYQESFFISESRTLDLVLELLPEEVAVPFIYIDIDSSPQGAQIWIDGEYCGVTPLREYFDRLGDHTFKLRLNGYKEYQESFYISESKTLDVVLKPIYVETPGSPTPEPFQPSPTPPGFLALSLLIAILFVYFFKFKNKR